MKKRKLSQSKQLTKYLALTGWAIKQDMIDVAVDPKKPCNNCEIFKNENDHAEVL